MNQIKTETPSQRNVYPYAANIDDRIIPHDVSTYYIFSYGESFGFKEINQSHPIIEAYGKTFELWDNTVYVDDRKIKGSASFDELVIKSYADLLTRTIPYPKGQTMIANMPGASIHIKGKAQALLVPEYDEEYKIETYQLHLTTFGEKSYINKRQVEGFKGEFKVGDKLVIGGILIERRPKQFKVTGISEEVLFNPRKIIVEPFIPEYPIDFPEYRRSPRILKTAPTDEVTVTKPKALETQAKGALLKTLLPPIMMVVMSVIMGLTMGRNMIMVVGMSMTAVVTAAFTVSAYFSDRKEVAKKNETRDEDYEQHLIKKQAELNRLETKMREALAHQYPSMETFAKMMHDYSPRLYERVTSNADFLEFALGVGTSSPSYKITFDAGEEPDELTRYAQTIINERRTLEDIPVRANLLGETLGLIGIYPVLKTAVQTILFQIAAFHSYKDVEFIALVPDARYETDFKDWRWLPHFKINALNLRGLIHSERSRDMVLNSFYQLITKRKQALKEGKDKELKFSTHYVLTILDDTYLSGHGLNEYLAEDMSKYGVTVIWCKESQAMLPETVTTMVEYFSSQAGTLINESSEYVKKAFTPCEMPKKIPAPVAISRLANLKHVEVEKNAIPKVVTFLDMYKVKKVDELDILNRWEQANTAKSLSVPLGLRGKDDIVELNLHERAHGPHGLVAGTTGSGKSEIVQSYILSLAINFSPEDFGFLVIDFKGGGMANEFANLPHLMGAITNLDGAASARALASIQAELKKRQSEFGKYGVNHINGYTKLYKKGKEMAAEQREKENLPDKPIPHLFLISDEFAELKANEPEFMAELVSVARIGRSLGVHLILATQKPSGVVDDQIWSNSRFKLALKVADESDSNEIIKTPDAASITEPGRAYLQVGNNEIYELFQSAWSGPDYDPDKTVEEKIDDRVWLINDLGQYELLTLDSEVEDEEIPGAKKEDLPTELRAIVDYIDELSKENDTIIPDKPWLPPLGEEIVTPDVNREEEWVKDRDLKVEIAMMDFPDSQDQKAYMFDLEEAKHTAIYGSAGFGKSTTLQTIVMALARRNSPQQVQFNLFDFGTNGLLPLKDLPHTADLVRSEDEEKLNKFLEIVKKEVSRRKELFTEVSVASLTQYEAKTDAKLPVIVTVVDAYDGIKEDNNLSDAVSLMLMQLVRDGANVGMYLLVTGLKANTLKMNVSGNIPTKIGLFLNDANDLSDIVGREKLPIQELVGRAQIKLDSPRSMQIYMPSGGVDEFERLQNLDTEVAQINESWTGMRPKEVPMLPKEIDMSWFKANVEVKEWINNGDIPLAFSSNTTEVRGYRPQIDPYFLIADGDMSQTEYITQTLEEVLPQLGNTYNRVVFDSEGNFEDRHDLFDEIYQTSEAVDVLMQIASYVKGSELSEVKATSTKTTANTNTGGGSITGDLGATSALAGGLGDVFTNTNPTEMSDIDLGFMAFSKGITLEELKLEMGIPLEVVEPDVSEEVATEEEAVALKTIDEEVAVIEAEAEIIEESEEQLDISEWLMELDTLGVISDDEEETPEEVFEPKTPMLIYIPNASEVLGEIELTDSDAKTFIKKAKDVEIHIIFHAHVSSLNSFRTGLGRYIKEMTRTGFVGQRSSDQQFVNAKKNYNETQMSDGEHSYFNKKTIERVRTIATVE